MHTALDYTACPRQTDAIIPQRPSSRKLAPTEFRMSMNGLRMWCLAGGLAACVQARGADKALIDYFLPMPIRGELSTSAWGAANVLPRDVLKRPTNGWPGGGI
jgi:hypothetical protein